MTRKSKTTSDQSLAVLQRMSMKDLLLVPDTADLAMANMAQYADADPAMSAQMEATSRANLEMVYGYGEDREGTSKPFVFNDGIAVIPVHGTLINRFNSSWGFVTGYNFIRRQMNAALDDDDVELIVFDIDSPGGEASGCFELCREIMASRRVKPSIAMVDSLAASGGLAIMCSATAVSAIPSARIGSCGVYRMHVSYEAAMKKDGIKVTFAVAGEHKIDGNPYKDLPQAVLDEWTESAGKTWDDFISLVAEARDMEPDDVRATQAQVYRADEALALGLIDAVKTTTEAIAAWTAELADATPSTDDDEEDTNMAELPNKTGKQEVTSGLTQDMMTAMSSMIASAVSAAFAPLAAQTRATAIMTCAEAKGKPALAAALAADESISLESAKTLLKVGIVEGKGKSKGKVGDVKDEDDDADSDGDDDGDGEGDGEGDDDEDGEGDDADGEEAADAARARRLKGKGKGGKVKSKTSRDNVNHLDNAMGRNRVGSPGGGDDGENDNDDNSEAAQTARILGDHANVAGADWSSKALKSAKKSK